MKRGLFILVTIASLAGLACSSAQPNGGDDATQEQESQSAVAGASKTRNAPGKEQREPVKDISEAPADRAAAIESAKTHLRRWAAKVTGVSADEIDTRPMAGKSEWKHSKLDVGALFALEAVAGKERLRAFVSADGRLVSLRDRRSFGPLAQALGLLDSDVDAGKAAQHIEFLFGRGPRLATTRSDFHGFPPPANFAPPSMKDSQGRAALIFFTYESGRTGSIVSTRHVLLTDADYERAELKSEKAR